MTHWNSAIRSTLIKAWLVEERHGTSRHRRNRSGRCVMEDFNNSRECGGCRKIIGSRNVERL
ncbi:hypothetical protein J6590_034008 [Homalodisca vitripennis]|nr:hypothetical protein J6590_034008 [Homalodisca vitripennis]